MWQDVAEWRELGLPNRSAKAQENLSTHVKEHAPLELEDSVMVQNQAGNNALRCSRRGVVVEVLPNRQYRVRMDGSRRIRLRNRQFLRKFTPIHENLGDKIRKLPPTFPVHTRASQVNSDTESGATTPAARYDTRLASARAVCLSLIQFGSPSKTLTLSSTGQQQWSQSKHHCQH